MAAMQAKYPDDNFEAVIRKNANSGVYEFRIKCADCPGKVCTVSSVLNRNALTGPPSLSIIHLGQESLFRTSKSTSKIVSTASR